MAAATRTYDTGEVAALLGVSPWLIYQQVRAGSCPLPHIKLGRRLLFPKAAIDRLLDCQHDPGPAVQ